MLRRVGRYPPEPCEVLHSILDSAIRTTATQQRTNVFDLDPDPAGVGGPSRPPSVVALVDWDRREDDPLTL